MKGDLHGKFREYDKFNTGIIKKADFIDVLSKNIHYI